MKNLILILFSLATSSFVFGQDICESILTADLAKLETKLSSLENDKGDIDAFSRDLESATNQLKACVDNTDGDLSSQKAKLAKLKESFKIKTAEFTASSPINVKLFFTQFSTIGYKVSNFPGGSYRNDFDAAVVNRKNLEFFLTYDIHPYQFEIIDEKNIYEELVKRINESYKEAMAKFNSEAWVKAFEYHLKSAQETKDLDHKKRVLNKMEQDLLLWQELLFPNSKKLKGYLARVRASK